MLSKQKSEGTRRSRSFILGLAVIAALVYSVISLVRMQVEIAQKSIEYEQLSQRLNEIQTQNEQLERYADDAYKMDYIESIARDDLDFSYADEKIYYFVPSS